MVAVIGLVASGIVLAGSLPLVFALRGCLREVERARVSVADFRLALGPAIVDLRRDAEATHDTALRLLSR